jgi:hypothetical protein
MNWKSWAWIAALTAAALVPSARAAQTGGFSAPTHRASSASGSAQTSGSAPFSETSSSGVNQATPGSASGGASENSSECEGGSCAPPPSHITIATPAPAPGPWPWQDRISWAANILLVLLAYIGIMLALSTLRKIERNTRYAEAAAQAAAESAKTALLYAQANTQSERPWILITAEPAPGAPDTFTIVATNRGRTPAQIVALDEEIALTKDESTLPPEPAFKNADAQRPPIAMILLPGESVGVKSFRRDEVPAVCETPDHLRKVENWEEKIYLFGKVTYTDLRSPDESKTHETIWCCWYIHGRQKSGMVLAGPRAYNQHS